MRKLVASTLGLLIEVAAEVVALALLPIGKGSKNNA